LTGYTYFPGRNYSESPGLFSSSTELSLSPKNKVTNSILSSNRSNGIKVKKNTCWHTEKTWYKNNMASHINGLSIGRINKFVSSETIIHMIKIKGIKIIAITYFLFNFNRTSLFCLLDRVGHANYSFKFASESWNNLY